MTEKTRPQLRARFRWYGALILLIALAGTVTPGLAPASSPSGEEIRIGMSTALSGPVRVLGVSMRQGVEAAFAEANAGGGIHGRLLRLIVLDDGYHPATTARNMRRLIDDHQVVAVIGNVGTPTARTAIPIARSNGVLFFGALSGAALLRAYPPDRYVINFRASYAEEINAMIEGLLAAGIKPDEIGFFTQDDSYGASGYESAITILEAHGFADARRLAHGRYPRNTLKVEPALVALMNAPVTPRAIIMVGSYAPSAKFIRLARQVFPDARFLNVSFVGSGPLRAALREAGNGAGDGVIITEVVPPIDAALPAVEAFRAAMRRFAPTAKPGVTALEGYLAARVFLMGVEAAPDISREAIIDSLEDLGEFDLGIATALTLSSQNHQASHKIWPMVIKGEGYEPLDWTAIP